MITQHSVEIAIPFLSFGGNRLL